MTDPSASSSGRPPRRRRRRGPKKSGSTGSNGGAPQNSEASSDDTSAADDAPAKGTGIPVDDCAFAEFNLRDDLIKGIAAAGYRTPSPIQAGAIPHALDGRDVIGQARTGTGKTCAFLVPALNALSDKPGPRVLVVVPTRELAMQVHEESRKLGKFMKFRSLAIYGGDPMKRQLDELEKGVQVIAATPGRLLDHLSRRTFKIDDLDYIILDEADRMFDLGFREDIDKIMRHASNRAQTMLFSATLSEEVLSLSAKFMNDPAKVFLAPDKMTVEEVDQTCFAVVPERKTTLLVAVLQREKPERSIIFTRTKIGADKLAMRLQKKGFKAQEIHSGLPQGKREKILAGFRAGTFPYLIATDVAARGIDIPEVTHVINYDIPEHAEDYVHRIGRTARMGKKGRAVTFVCPDDGMFLTGIEKLINQVIPGDSYDDVDHAPPKREQQTKTDGPQVGNYQRTLGGYIRTRKR
ncbi:MAG: DEAD/DEAH box helicase [Planctomycetota bacterium]|nr:MAG: DEAD/DEAH box helicase [Planctomycetota bacterium]